MVDYVVDYEITGYGTGIHCSPSMQMLRHEFGIDSRININHSLPDDKRVYFYSGTQFLFYIEVLGERRVGQNNIETDYKWSNKVDFDTYEYWIKNKS